MKSINTFFISLLVIGWVFSLTLVGIIGQELPITGFGILVIGWMGPVNGIFSWYANPLALFVIIFLLRQKYKSAIWFSFVSVVLGLQALVFQGKDINYGGSSGPFGVLSTGYYFWMLLLIMLFLLSLINLIKGNNEKNLAIDNNTPSVISEGNHIVEGVRV